MDRLLLRRRFRDQERLDGTLSSSCFWVRLLDWDRGMSYRRQRRRLDSPEVAGGC